MICTSVILCLSTGLANKRKIMSMFVLFSRFLAILKVWAFFENSPNQLNRMFLVSFPIE